MTDLELELTKKLFALLSAEATALLDRITTHEAAKPQPQDGHVTPPVGPKP